MQRIIFKEKQPFVIVWVSCIAALALIGTAGFGLYFNAGDMTEQIPLIVICLIFLLFMTLLFMFYDMKITLTSAQFEVKFGIGVFKKKFDLKDINVDTISIDKPSKWYGIGWRYKLNGDLILNTKYGKSVCFSLYENNKMYHVVTSNFDEIKRELIKACNKIQKSRIE